MNISWDDAQLFLAIAETRSLSAAARVLRIGQPTVSRRLQQLEYEVGTALFLRRVDGVALTVAGERLVEPARKMAEWAGELNRAAAATDSRPHGLVRVTASPWVCFDFWAPFAGWFQAEQPGLRLEVLSTMQYLDLARGEADLAIRSKPPAHADVETVCTIDVENAVYVSKALAEKLPKKPSLAEIPWIGWAPPFENIPPQPQLEAMIDGFTPVFTADNFLVHLAAAEAGVGAMVLSRSYHRFARQNSLIALPVDLGPWAKVTAYLLSAKSGLDIPRVRIVAQAVEREMRAATNAKARRSRSKVGERASKLSLG